MASSRISKSEQNLALKMRICLGMMFSVLCPGFSWQIEVQRLKITHERGLKGMSEDTKVSMSGWWLAPHLFISWGKSKCIDFSLLLEFIRILS